jgi:hypothetical protein
VREVRSLFTVDHTRPEIEINEPSETVSMSWKTTKQINVNVDVEDGLRSIV